MKTTIKKKKKRGVSFFLKDLSGWMLMLPSIVLVVMFVVRPQILGVIWSTFNMRGFTVQDFIGLRNFQIILSNADFLKTFTNTWLYLIYSLIVGLLPPFVMAIIMNEMACFRKTIRTLVYLPGIMPAISVSILWSFVYYPDATGLLNMVLGMFGMEPYVWLQDGRFTILWIIVSMTWTGMGGTAIYYFAGLQGVNSELYEAAMMDGAGFIRRLRTVTIPHMLPMFMLFAVRQCVGVFQVVNQPLQMTGGGPNNASMSLGLLAYNYAFVNGKPQFAMALNVITFFVIIIFTLIYYKVDKKVTQDLI